MGILVELDQHSAKISTEDDIDQIVFTVDRHELRVKGSLLKRFVVENSFYYLRVFQSLIGSMYNLIYLIHSKRALINF